MTEDPRAQVDGFKDKFEDFTQRVRMDSIVREVNNLRSKTSKLSERVESIRKRDYVFSSFLENQVEIMGKRWDEIHERIDKMVDQESEDLKGEFDETEQLIDRAHRRANNPRAIEELLPRLEEAIDSLESKVEAAEGRVRGLYSDLRDDVNKVGYQLDKIDWYCDMKDEAGFDFLAGESLFLTAKAEWDDGNDKPDGILYLTDQRLIFEQKEKTGKRFGMFGGKQTQEVEWALPLNQIEEVEPENKGMFGGKDMLNFTLGSGAPYATLVVEVKGGVDCKFWAKQIDRMVSGDVNDERAIPPDPEMLDQLRNAPTECHVCGGKIPMLVAGQNQVECEYCGSVIRI